MFPVASIASSIHRRPSGAGEPALSNDTSLSVFTINGTPVSNGGTVNLAYGVTTVDPIATANHPGATVGTITGYSGLVTGNNTLEFDVTAEDGVTVQNYNVTLVVAGIVPAYSSGVVVKARAPATGYNYNAAAYIGGQCSLDPVTGDVGSWLGDPYPTFTYDWRVDDVTVGTGITSPEWLAEDEGKPAKVIITGTNAFGSDTAEVDLGNIATFV